MRTPIFLDPAGDVLRQHAVHLTLASSRPSSAVGGEDPHTELRFRGGGGDLFVQGAEVVDHQIGVQLAQPGACRSGDGQRAAGGAEHEVSERPEGVLGKDIGLGEHRRGWALAHIADHADDLVPDRLPRRWSAACGSKATKDLDRIVRC